MIIVQWWRAKRYSDDIAAVFSCAVITGVGAVVNTAKFSGRLLQGWAALVCQRWLKAPERQIIAIDPVKYKRMGKQLGGLSLDADDPNIIEKVKDATGGGLAVWRLLVKL